MDNINSNTKFCTHCGRQIKRDAAICPFCGCSAVTTQERQEPEQTDTIGIASIVLAFIIPLAGLILGIIGLNSYKDPRDIKNCKIGIGISIGFIAISVIIVLLALCFMFFLI